MVTHVCSSMYTCHTRAIINDPVAWYRTHIYVISCMTVIYALIPYPFVCVQDVRDLSLARATAVHADKRARYDVIQYDNIICHANTALDPSTGHMLHIHFKLVH